MNFALSQRRTDRHPVGLMVVVGLHVLVAAALLSSRLHAPQGEPKPLTLEPLPPVVKVEPKPTVLPPASERKLKLEPVLPVIKLDHPESTLQVVKEDNHPPLDPPTLVARLELPVAPLTHVTGRAAVLNAAAATCHPDYPAAAQRAGATGVSRLRFTVDALGRIASAQILQSSGSTHEHRLMDRAAADALAHCPVTVGTDESGHAVGGTADVDYVWSLN